MRERESKRQFLLDNARYSLERAQNAKTLENDKLYLAHAIKAREASFAALWLSEGEEEMSEARDIRAKSHSIIYDALGFDRADFTAP